MKAVKFPKLYQRLGIAKREIRASEPIKAAHGLGYRLAEGCELADAPCPVCRKPLGLGRLGTMNLNLYRRGGCWYLCHIGHSAAAIREYQAQETPARHRAHCQACADYETDYLIRTAFARLEQGIYDAYDAERECCAGIGRALARIGDPNVSIFATEETESAADESDECEETDTLAVA